MNGWLCWKVRRVRCLAQVGEVVGEEGKRRPGRSSVGIPPGRSSAMATRFQERNPKFRRVGLLQNPKFRWVYCTWMMCWGDDGPKLGTLTRVHRWDER